nr:polysaccharide biosynthesis tyrosine autokinase [uncultured Erwinia sp.]
MSSVTSKKTLTSESDEIDLGRIVGELIDHKKLIISITAMVTTLALLYALFSTPIYQADALIQVEQKQGNALLDSLSKVLPDSPPESAPEISLLQSRMILGQTVDDLILQAAIDEKYFPIFGRGWAKMLGESVSNIQLSSFKITGADKANPEITLKVIDNNNYQIDYGDFSFKGTRGALLEQHGVSILVKNIEAEPGTEFTIQYQSRLQAMNNLLKSFGVAEQSKNSGMLELTITGVNPKLISETLNTISQNYLQQNIERQAAQNEKSLEFLKVQLPKVRTDLDLAEDKLNQYRRQKDSVDLSMEAKSVLDQIVNVDNQLNELTFREAEISQLFTKEHPTYKALIEKKTTLQAERNKFNEKVSSMPATQQEVIRLSRDVDSGRAVYMQLLNKQQELSIAKSSAIGNVRIIDNAITAPAPVKPNKPLVVIVGFILGLMLSSSIVLFKILMRRGIENPEQLEELGINVYASIPISDWLSSKINKKSGSKSRSNDGSVFLAAANPADIAIEAIRGLRTSLHFAMLESSNNVLMISGASPEAGKTFVSSNLSAIISQTGKKVLYIDGDMRKGYAHKLFNADNNIGLSDILSGVNNVEKCVKHSQEGGFDYIARGQTPPNPAELLMRNSMSELIKWASSSYDLVIIDTPPILAVTDAAIIGRYAGATLLIARFEKNTPKEIEISIKRFEQSGVHVSGCILNGIIKKASGYYGYGYNHYGYSYKDE